jgi:predicted transglutaminase-like cysteine proteinase
VRQAITTVVAAAVITGAAVAAFQHQHDAISAASPFVAARPLELPFINELPQWATYSVSPATAEYAQQPLWFASFPPETHFDPFALSDGAGHAAPLAEAHPRVLPTPQERTVSLGPTRHKSANFARQLKSPIVQIQFGAPALAPMAHTMFCLQYQNDCKVHKIVFRGGGIKLTAEKLAELERVNAAVNRNIAPEANTAGLAGEKWLISPKSGDCNDYAVTKRHELLARGWPARNLLLSEVVTSWGEHHLVLVVRTSAGDFVADSLEKKLLSLPKARYEWVRIQSPGNPRLWATVAGTTVMAKSGRLADSES